MPTQAKYTQWKEKVIDRLHQQDVEKTPPTKRELLLLMIIWNHSEEIDQELYEEAMAAAINEAGGCSQCGDLNGYSCICEDDGSAYLAEEDYTNFSNYIK